VRVPPRAVGTQAVRPQQRLPLLLLLAASVLWACGSDGAAVDRLGGDLTVLPSDTGSTLAPPGASADAFPTPTRPIADIVAPRWSNEDDRDDAGEADRVLRLVEAAEGMHVADIGAGDGYYVARLAARVGDAGRVYGEDIVPRYVELLSARARTSGWSNVEVVRGESHDPRLPAGTLDAAILIHMYHEVSQPFGLLWNLATAMKPGGRVLIMDLDRPTWGHGTPLELLRCEVEAVGYRLDRIDRTVPGEYAAVFIAPSLDERPAPEAIVQSLASAPCTATGRRE
jgi:ubiquinone/menaquinone biosynthesis C-methylase UbiE